MLDLSLIHLTCVWPVESSTANSIQLHGMWMMSRKAMKIIRKSNTGAVMTMGSGTVFSLSTKQKVEAHSSTEAELVAVDDVIAKILWTKKFIEWQGFEVKLNILYQDNEHN